MFRVKTLAVAAMVVATVACGGGSKGKGGPKAPENPGDKSGLGGQIDKEAQSSYEAALDHFLEVDKSGKWEEGCDGVAESFIAAATKQKAATNKRFPEAIYNAGLAYQRCNKDAKAQELFREALKADSQFHRARAQLALFEYKQNKDLNGTIRKLDGIIRDAKFQNVEALVYLAALQMEADLHDDALKNLQRALAIDDGFMPAFNQLAVYYLENAKRSANENKGKRRRRALVVSGGKKVSVNTQQLDLAALVASQAMRKNPNYAPIHNTAGLIQVELKNYNGAVKSFRRARALDPKFFEAHMNYGAVNLSFRGFGEAEKAYRDAIKLNPKEYEAHLGLALAVRGQINDANFDKNVALAQKHLDECKKIDPARPETYYNEAILTQEFKAKGSEEESIPNLEKAAKLYREFAAKAGSSSEFKEAVKRSEARSQDITDTVQFIKDGIRLKKEQDAANDAAKRAKERQAKEDAAKKKEEEAKAKEEAAKGGAKDKPPAK
jgi:tetratricopeptide (TPR) repeat protein